MIQRQNIKFRQKAITSQKSSGKEIKKSQAQAESEQVLIKKQENLSQKASGWQKAQPLFATLAREEQELLEKFHAVLQAVRPLKTSHQKHLPQETLRLSRLLTSEREFLHYSYWAKPNSTSAYLYYFLPWNIIRLARLFKNLSLPDPQAWLAQNCTPWLLDAGCGPFTIPLALWLAKAEWRELPLAILALDTSSQVLDLGQKLLQTWAEISQIPLNWRIVKANAPLEHLPSELAKAFRNNKKSPKNAVWLLSSHAVLNELYGKSQAKREFVEQEAESRSAKNFANEVDFADHTFDLVEEDNRFPVVWETFEPLIRKINNELVPVALFAEPGTRLGGKIIVGLRNLVRMSGYNVIAPCPHNKNCPLLKQQSTWCHFNFERQSAPKWLVELAQKTGLAQKNLTISFILVQKQEGQRVEQVEQLKPLAPASQLARVISNAFFVPNHGQARYACSQKGLLLLENALELPNAGLLPVNLEHCQDRDAKSNALIVPRPNLAPTQFKGQKTQGAETEKEQRKITSTKTKIARTRIDSAKVARTKFDRNMPVGTRNNDGTSASEKEDFRSGFKKRQNKGKKSEIREEARYEMANPSSRRTGMCNSTEITTRSNNSRSHRRNPTR